jgi:Trp operon repressor
MEEGMRKIVIVACMFLAGCVTTEDTGTKKEYLDSRQAYLACLETGGECRAQQARFQSAERLLRMEAAQDAARAARMQNASNALMVTGAAMMQAGQPQQQPMTTCARNGMFLNCW